jgi:predicted amidohydrolase YtcJ
MNTVLKSLSIIALLLLAGPARTEDLLIKAGKVYTMTGPPLAPGLVHVADGKIVAVGTDLKTPEGT